MKNRTDVSEFWDFVARRTSGKVSNRNILFSGIVGSRSLGLNNEDSDYDIRCVFSNTLHDELGVDRFDYFSVKEGTGGINYSGHFDGSGYSVSRFIRDLYKGEFNVAELLFVNESYILHFDERLELLMMERNQFLTGSLASSMNSAARYNKHRAFRYSLEDIKNDDRKRRVVESGYDVKSAARAYMLYRGAQRLLCGDGFNLLGNDTDFLRSIRCGSESKDLMLGLLQAEDERTHLKLKDKKSHEVRWVADSKLATSLIVDTNKAVWGCL